MISKHAPLPRESEWWRKSGAGVFAPVPMAMETRQTEELAKVKPMAFGIRPMEVPALPKQTL